MSPQRIFPVSFGQHRLLFLEQFDPGTAAYNLTRVVRIIGALDRVALIKALRNIVQRHAVLRTKFFVQEDSYQIVDDEIEFQIPLLDIAHLPASARESEALRLAREEGQKGFNLTLGPLFRFALIYLSQTDHILVLVMHHIVTDAWSMGIMFEEIGELYADLAYGKPTELPTLSVQFSEFAQWQRDYSTERNLHQQITYWTTKLSGHNYLIELPTDRARPSVQSHDGAIERFQIDETLTGALTRLAESCGGTMFMLLLATLQTLIWRYTNEEDILIGTPIAARNDPEFEKVMGFFVNTLVIRGDLSGNPTFLELLRRTREATLEAYEHQDLPFEKLVEVLNPPRSQSYSPLFQIMLVLQNAPKRTLNFPGLELQEMDFDGGTAKFDLTLEVVQENGLHCSIEYSTALFDKQSIQRLARHFETLLRDLAKNPNRPISEFGVLDDAARNELIFHFNSTESKYRKDARLEQIFEEQVKRTPDRVALVEGGSEISYRELNARANALARLLLRKNLNQERPVGVYMRRSIDAFVAFIAAFKANTPYVPLDVSNPRHRIEIMIRGAGCSVIITHRGLHQELPDDVEVISLDDSLSLEESLANFDRLPTAGSAEDLAYIIFTSGSTGFPKGVEGSHRAAINRFEWMWQKFPFSADETCCQKTALGFVDSIWESFGPLLAGVRIVIVPDELLLEIELFVALLARFGVTRIVLVPSVLRALLEAVPHLATRLPKLRLWSSSGETLAPEVVRRFREVLPTARLLNIYGSSEVTADVTFHEVNQSEGLTSVPIGKPISNSQILILDRNKNLVPPLVRGEIHVGGDCLARGYWRQYQLTSERFIPNPYDSDRSDMLFATGDLGRILGDGTIEYLGRLDKQIKLRGMRIEPGEIEATLNADPDVAEACVVVQGETAEARHLVAYIVKSKSSTFVPDELRLFLRGRLPQYMVPADFVEVDRIPLLPSGKIDRTALPIPSLERVGKRRTIIQGRTEIEKKLSCIWQEVLEVDQISTDDNFFDLGGHSLSAMRVHSRIRRDFHVDIPVRTLFDRPTIAELAAEIEEEVAAGGKVQSPVIGREIASSFSVLNILQTELSKLPADQLDALLKSVIAARNEGPRD